MKSISAPTIIFILIILLECICPEFTISSKNRLLPPKEIVDTCTLSIGYLHRTYDPILEQTKCEDEILLIGSNHSWYGSYGAYMLDSLVNANPEMSSEEFGQHYKSLDPFPQSLLKYFDTGSYRYAGRIFANSYKYEEEIPQINWQICEETDTILEQECRKAICDFRGRKWTAWYSETPISDGPWMFTGLPGLILKLSDSENEHIIEAFELRTNSIPFGWKKRLYVKTSREKYLKELADYKNDPWKLAETMVTEVKEADGTIAPRRKQKLFYNPIELE